MRIGLTLIFSLVSLNAASYEIDNFTQRYEPLRDGCQTLNTKMNESLQSLVEKENRRISQSRRMNCDGEKLKRYIFDSIGQFLIGSFESYVQKNPVIDKHFNNKTNIYTGMSFFDGPVLKSVGTNVTFNLCGHYIGADKLGHFIDEGYNAYQVSNSSGEMQALYSLLNKEQGVYGWTSTGVASYADLVASYEGYLFWKNLTGGPEALLSCQNGVWSKNKSFDWRDYINDGFDEGINCSVYASQDFASIVNQNLNALEAKNPGKNFHCPVEVKPCHDLIEKYGKEKSQYLLGPGCR